MTEIISKLAMETLEYFLNHNYQIISPNFIVFTLYPGALNILSQCRFPGDDKREPNISLTLYLMHGSAAEFAAAFNLTSPAEIDSITSDTLYEMFRIGKAEVRCSDGKEELFFGYRNGGMYLRNELEDAPVSRPPHKPQEFIRLSKKFFNRTV